MSRGWKRGIATRVRESRSFQGERERERRGWTKYRRRKEERKIESRVRNAKIKDFERTLHNGKLIKWRNDDESKGGDLMEILGKLAGKGFLKCMKNVSRIGWY